MIRLGLCCKFRDVPIRFPTTTAASLSRLARAEGLAKLSRLCLENAEALVAALTYCGDSGIGCFRVSSQILPLKTHPTCGYEIEDLPDRDAIVARFRQTGELSRQRGIRTCFHPDQFIVLNSQRPDVVNASIAELEYQAMVSEWINADVLTIHGGGAFGNKQLALDALSRSLERLSPAVRARLALENDDRVYTPADLLPLCRRAGLPLVYDVHHHRCNGDGESIEETTAAAVGTWDREPLFHLSSPINGWDGATPERHHDFIDPSDVPPGWLALSLTIEVEAKAKEVAVAQLAAQLKNLAAR